MEDTEWRVNFDASDGVMCINGDTLITDGTLSYSIIKEEDEKNDRTSIKIKGVFCTNYYVGALNRIETRRHVLDNIDVIEEGYGSHEDRIVYKFECETAQIKYQDNSVVLPMKKE